VLSAYGTNSLSILQLYVVVLYLDILYISLWLIVYSMMIMNSLYILEYTTL